MKNIDAVELKMADATECRACGVRHRALEAHHLVPRSQGGDDVGPNIFALCPPCHHALTHSGGYAAKLVGERIRHNMSPSELNYVLRKIGRGRMDKRYPLKNSGSHSSSLSEPERAGASSPNWEETAAEPSQGRAPQPGIPSETPYWIEPGKDCPTCKRRVPHPKKESSPTSAVFSHRGPLDSKDEYNEILEAAAKHGGMGTEQKFWKHEAIIRMCAVLLAGPPGQLVSEP